MTKKLFLCIGFIAASLMLGMNAHAQKFEQLAKTPQLGWNSWNTFACNINEKLIRETGKDVACLLLDEVQFLGEGQVDDLLRIAIDEDVPVLAYGIRTDFQTVAFPGSRRLLEIAHSLEELKTICRCGRKAVFNARTVNGQFVFDGDQVAIDGDAEVSYESLCGACYLEESGGVLNRGWRPKLDFSYKSAPDSDFT